MLIKRKWLAASIVAALGAAGATVMHIQRSAEGGDGTAGASQSSATGGSTASTPGGSTPETYTEPYIVVMTEAPLASYRGGVSGLAAPSRMTGGRGGSRLDVRSANARRYVQFLQQVQTTRTADLGRAVGRPLHVRFRMQHALNAIVADLTPDEAARLAAAPGVAFVEAYHEYPLATDVGPGLIGAEPVWNGTAPGESGRFQGEGIVVGIIDSGINFASPSFSAIDPVDGYRHVNELGSGNYLGTCAPGGPDEGRCNDKLIGGYDFVCNVQTSPTNPALNLCNQPAVYREEPGFGDTNSHGSHVASTAAGNRRDITYKGAELRISGVAPRANIIAYDTCYTNVATGQGLCPNVSTAAAVNQAVADGVVDVLNYSIGGGTNPWGDAISQAFLNAVDAGIYVAAAAGNSGPGPATTGHHQPWVGTTAASQHGRADFVLLMDVTGPAPVPEALRGIILNEGGGSPGLANSLPAGTPLRVSPGIDTAADGCAAFPSGAFTGSVALVRRGTCAFSVKASNAAAAGAVAVLIANNGPGAVTPSVPGATVPVFGMTQADGDAIRDFAGGPGGVVAVSIPKAAVARTNTPDQLAAFSSRGPGLSGGILKPDVTAPGVSVLAAISGTTLAPGSENVVGLLSGTSMASPHHTGAVALIRQGRPTWTPAEVKSALVMTATRAVLMEDGITPADPFARGGGRIRVDEAIRAGLVLDETKVNYLAANPATGGDPSSLNLPNLIDSSCFERCTFTRTFRNTQSYRQAWSVKVEGLDARAVPATFVAAPGESVTVRFTVHARRVANDGRFNFGEVVLQPRALGNPNQPELRLPVAVAVQPPAAVLPLSLDVSVPAGGKTTVPMTLGNGGGSLLRFSVDNTGSAAVEIANTAPTAAGSGFRSARYIDAVNPPSNYAADDFELGSSTRLTTLVARGFLLSSTPLAAAAQSITWGLYPDAGGVPAGHPDTGGAVWSFTAAPSAAGVGTAGSVISLDLAAAGQDVVLPKGRYWLVVSARTTFANRWVWYASDTASAGSLAGLATITPAAGGWATNTAFPGLSWLVAAQVPCGAGWIARITPPIGSVEPGASSVLSLGVDARGLAAGQYEGYACIASNDPRTPRTATRIALTVTP